MSEELTKLDLDDDNWVDPTDVSGDLSNESFLLKGNIIYFKNVASPVADHVGDQFIIRGKKGESWTLSATEHTQFSTKYLEWQKNR